MKMNLRILGLVMVAAILVSSCGGPAALTGAVVARLPAGDPTDEVLKNGAYEVPYLGPVQLTDGGYERVYGTGTSMVNTVGYTQAAFGDLNKDGIQDAAAIIWGNAGGAGEFVYLVAVTNRGKILRQAAHVLLGNRVQIVSLTISGGKIVAKTLGFAATDPACCPSVEATQTFVLEGNVLVEKF
jgi:hypothetical protein